MKLNLNLNKILFLAISVVMFTTACVSVNYPQRSYYMLHVKMPRPGLIRSRTKILEVVNPTIVQQYTGLSFVYRTTNIHYLHDYYNLFFVSPEQQIHQNIVRYLQATRIVKHVASGATILDVDYMLQPKIVALYADYRNSRHPKGVMAIKFILTTTGKKSRLLFSKTLYAAVPLSSKSSHALLMAWNRGLQQILYKLNVALREKIS